MQYQFVGKKQAVRPAVPNSDTLVDASVTVYPRRRQPTARGQDPARQARSSGPQPFYQIVVTVWPV